MGVTAADIPRFVRQAPAVYAKWGGLIHKYHGGVPESLIVVRAIVESDGTMDMRVGSDTAVGLLSVTESQEDRFGVPRGTRLTPDGNIFLAALRNNVDTAITLKRYPHLVSPRAHPIDAYLFGGALVSAIGVGAAYYLFTHVPQGLTYSEFADWIEAHASALPEKGPWGVQSRSKIIYRVRAVWAMGEAAKRATGVPSNAGPPSVPPLPPGVRVVVIPREARDVMQGGAMPHAGTVSMLPWPLSLLKRIG